MIVMKFGGMSLRDAASIRAVGMIIRSKVEDHPVIVVSAHFGVTTELDRQAVLAIDGHQSLESVHQRHVRICSDLGIDSRHIDELLSDLEDVLRGISLVGELSPRNRDLVLSFGERWSARTLAKYLSLHGLAAVALDAFNAGLITDSCFGCARPVENLDREISTLVGRADGLPVITGFIGKDRAGNVTTLGRNGSDYSAAIIGKAMEAQEIQVWKDVDGIMTADPKLVREARPLKEITYEEAAELARFGGRVLHPSTIVPALERNIPVRVLNTQQPALPGTRILARIDSTQPRVTTIVHKRNQVLMNLRCDRTSSPVQRLLRVLSICESHGIEGLLIARSEMCLSLAFDSPENLEGLVADLGREMHVDPVAGVAIVSVVGRGFDGDPALCRKLFQRLEETHTRVWMHSHGASMVGLSFVIDQSTVPLVIRDLHGQFVEALWKDDEATGAMQ